MSAGVFIAQIKLQKMLRLYSHDGSRTVVPGTPLRTRAYNINTLFRCRPSLRAVLWESSRRGRGRIMIISVINRIILLITALEL